MAAPMGWLRVNGAPDLKRSMLCAWRTLTTFSDSADSPTSPCVCTGASTHSTPSEVSQPGPGASTHSTPRSDPGEPARRGVEAYLPYPTLGYYLLTWVQG